MSFSTPTSEMAHFCNRTSQAIKRENFLITTWSVRPRAYLLRKRLLINSGASLHDRVAAIIITEGIYLRGQQKDKDDM